jgi:7-cyano-7-deazaguanine synthase
VKRALLLSGGMDSISLAFWRRPDVSITIDYGQLPAEAEIASARAFCAAHQIPHEVVSIDCRLLGSGDLIGRPSLAAAPASDWWPYRNQLLATIAASKAVALGVTHLELGTVASDSVHADGTPAFIQALDHLLSLQEGQMHVSAPAIHLRTTQLVRESGIPFSDLAWAHSCHKANVPCGECRGCYKHFEVWRELES